MRQRRQRLQVSTFPFLAVLLCAMGSLILLLLVMDRRAKVVARAKAMRTMEQALAQAAAEEERAAAAHREEWERRRQRLHEQLEQEDQQVLGWLEGVQEQVTAAIATVQKELSHTRELEKQLGTEQSGVARSLDELTTRRAEISTAAQQADASRSELIRLTADLERMERCIADLKAARQRQQQRVSLVPYRGKRGDNRTPIYIECSEEAVIFHPDRLAISTSKGVAIRDEIERRLARQRSETRTVAEKPGENAYLLMLVRPNGIATYYRVLAALTGLRVDFGYEFIDQDWILDFSEDDKPKTQPWLVAERAKEQAPSDHSKQTASGRPLPAGLPATGGAGLGRPMGILPAAPAAPGSALYGTGTGAGRQAVVAAASSGHDRAGGQLPGVARISSDEGRSFGARAGSLGSDRLSASPPALAQAGPPLSPGGTAEGAGILPSRDRKGAFPSTESGPQPADSGTAGILPNRDRNGAFPSAGSVDDGKPGANPQPADNGTPPRPGNEEPSGETTKPGLDVPPTLLPPRVLNPYKGGGTASSGAPQDGTGERAASATPSRSDSGESSPAQAGDPLDRLGSPNPRPKPARAVAARPAPLLGNRDWIIAIECRGDAIVLASRQRIATAQLEKRDNGNNPLLEAVQQLIARRQATVRPGEPAYRPMIRFRVRPDGLRSYHLAYPALEALHLPMTRENVDPEEVKADDQR